MHQRETKMEEVWFALTDAVVKVWISFYCHQHQILRGIAATASFSSRLSLAFVCRSLRSLKPRSQRLNEGNSSGPKLTSCHPFVPDALHARMDIAMYVSFVMLTFVAYSLGAPFAAACRDCGQVLHISTRPRPPPRLACGARRLVSSLATGT
jgi:hypothetical protein